ncbi:MULTISPECIES: hypothetical protein [unclassified Rhizobium]|uniref:hypothetical protein n=1 Tax=unclassified Rhizobium TaxID=2613769 RepID=UPI000788237C|nr:MULTISPECIES: hypothetical protein [unclassified Rhizobium]
MSNDQTYSPLETSFRAMMAGFDKSPGASLVGEDLRRYDVFTGASFVIALLKGSEEWRDILENELKDYHEHLERTKNG